ncbi:MAG: SDR family oxidoreductase [Gemmatimonadaceae bacterium]|nr:SDR family oxidoreductase [Gemmatimonadaceae bacterium]
MPDALFPLAGKVALVTGASTGIGRAIALALARAGADVAVTYRTGMRDATEVATEIERMGRRAAVFQLELADPASISTLARDLTDQFERVDIWINSAGADILTGDDAKKSRLEKLDQLLMVDLRGTILASWESARIMKEQPDGGVIINMSWDHVLFGFEGTNPQMFSAVKGGIMSFSKSLARSVAPKVRVNILAPGWIETEFAATTMDPEYYRNVVESTPLRRWGTPEDVARSAVFLASPDSAFLTGQMLMIGGGVVM